MAAYLNRCCQPHNLSDFSARNWEAYIQPDGSHPYKAPKISSVTAQSGVTSAHIGCRPQKQSPQKLDSWHDEAQVRSQLGSIGIPPHTARTVDGWGTTDGNFGAGNVKPSPWDVGKSQKWFFTFNTWKKDLARSCYPRSTHVCRYAFEGLNPLAFDWEQYPPRAESNRYSIPN